MGDAFYLHTIDVPYSYIASIADPFFSIAVFLFIYRCLFNYYARMDVVENEIYLVFGAGVLMDNFHLLT